jgi:hypothetical protein
VRRSRLTAFAAVAVLAAAGAVGCGGGGDDNDNANKSSSLSKKEYADALNTICKRANHDIAALKLTSSIENFRDHGDQILVITRRTINRFNAVEPAPEVKDAGKRFQQANQNLLRDIEQAVQAAKAGDQSKFLDASRKAQEDGQKSTAAANEIGADDCA